MTPTQLLPPVKPSEAVAIADLVFRLSQGRPWSIDLRGKLQSSLPALRLEKLQAFAHTLAPDPAHSSTFYLLIETNQEHWLLHIAPASAATSPLFPNPILLARVRPSGEREIVVNAIPAGANIRTIITGLYPNLIARPTSIHSLWSTVPGASLIQLLANQNKRSNVLPAVRTDKSTWQPFLNLLASNWRDGFVAILDQLEQAPTADEAEPFSRFSMIVEDPTDARRIANFDQQLRTVLRRGYDLELNLSSHRKLELDTLHTLLDNLKLIGVPIHSVEIDGQLHVAAFATMLRSRQVGLTLEASEPREPISGLRTHWKLSA